MKRSFLFASVASVVLAAACCKSADDFYSKAISAAEIQATAMYNALPEGRFPRTIAKDGTLSTSDFHWWCSGFYGGTLWLLNEATGNYIYDQYARKYTELLDTLTYDGSRYDHDIGFQVNCSYGNAYRITKNEAYKDAVVRAAYRLADRFSPTVGCTRSWDSDSTQFKVIIDNMMNLELLMVASQITSDEKLAQIAKTHANTTMKNHFREDGSTYHLVIYNPVDGTVIKKQTVQGFADESSWSRGQAWALYGYTMMYRFTKDPAYLQTATRLADLFIPRLPEDGIAYWDFDSDEIPDDFRDASAAAIMASALVELSTFVSGKPSKTYLKTARKILRTLSSDEYLAAEGTNCNFIIKHCVGNKPGNSEVDVPLSYADYYFLEALLRYKALEQSK